MPRRPGHGGSGSGYRHGGLAGPLAGRAHGAGPDKRLHPANRPGLRRAAGLVLAAAAAACGDGDADGRVAFSQVEVQAYLEREAARTLPGLAIGAASCPAQLPDRAGAAATCTVVVERATLEYEVQRLVGDRFEARPARPIVLVRDITSAIRSKLGAPAAQVQCGDAAVVQPATGQDVTCQVTGSGPPRPATVEVSADGTVIVTGT